MKLIFYKPYVITQITASGLGYLYTQPKTIHMKTTMLLLLSVLFIFQAKSQTKPNPSALLGVPLPYTKEGVSEDLMNEYATIVSKYDTSHAEWWLSFEKKVTPADHQRLQNI